jgi:hypothetical protein
MYGSSLAHALMIFAYDNFMNPYTSPSVASVPPVETRQLRRGALARWLLLYFSPVIGIASIYVAWLLAWISLGHPPRPMIDDPASIGGAMTMVYWATMLTTTCGMCLAPICTVTSFFCPIRFLRNDVVQGVILTMLYVAICTATVLFVRLDPGRVIEWWTD